MLIKICTTGNIVTKSCLALRSFLVTYVYSEIEKLYHRSASYECTCLIRIPNHGEGVKVSAGQLQELLLYVVGHHRLGPLYVNADAMHVGLI